MGYYKVNKWHKLKNWVHWLLPHCMSCVCVCACVYMHTKSCAYVILQRKDTNLDTLDFHWEDIVTPFNEELNSSFFKILFI